MKDNKGIVYCHGGVEKLDLIEPLWEKLNKYHKENSTYFKDRFAQFTFQSRKDKILNEIEDSVLNVILAKNLKNGKIIGYCVAKIDKENVGEIESIYVEAEYRGYKVGDTLMKQSLNWLKENGVKSKRIGVSHGNDGVINFYKKYGFYPRQIILEAKYRG